MSVEELEARVKELEEQVKVLKPLKDIEEIQRLQRAYGFYLEHWMANEVIDCFSDSPDTMLSLYEGTWLGKDGIRRYFNPDRIISPEFLHQVMQVSPIVTVEPDGMTARGRWYSWGAVAVDMENGVRQFFMGGIYECEYVKENNKWKILKLKYNLTLAAPPNQGWVHPKRVAKPDAVRQQRTDAESMKPDIPPGGMDTLYPSGYIFPFHFTHPITEKETSEKKRNDSLEYITNRFSRKE
ncbi:nuclear transport factor 2 family protein [Chloroflexota bacterium]